MRVIRIKKVDLVWIKSTEFLLGLKKQIWFGLKHLNLIRFKKASFIRMKSNEFDQD